MSENEKNTTHGEPISEEQLDTVSGGGGTGTGAVNDPHHSPYCWFRSEGETREDGRTKCISHCKGYFDNSYPYNDGAWWICCCWGTDYCIDRMHKHCGRPARTNW